MSAEKPNAVVRAARGEEPVGTAIAAIVVAVAGAKWGLKLDPDTILAALTPALAGAGLFARSRVKPTKKIEREEAVAAGPLPGVAAPRSPSPSSTAASTGRRPSPLDM